MFFARKGKPRTVKISVKWMGRDVFLLYRLYREPASEDERDICDGNVYSISVEMIDMGGQRVCAEEAYDVSRSKDEARQIFRTLCRGLVTPDTALEIISDIISIETEKSYKR